MKLQIATALLAFPIGAAAQNIDSLRGRVAELEEAYRTSVVLQHQTDSVRNAATATKTVTVFGNVSVELRGQALQHWDTPLTEAAARVAEEFGSPALFPGPFEISITATGTRVSMYSPYHNFGIGTTARPGASDDEVTGALENSFHSLILLTMGSEWRGWLGSATPLNPDDIDRRRAFTDFVTTPYSTTRACIAGSIADCMLGLGLNETTTTRYPGMDLKHFIKRSNPAGSYLGNGVVQQYRECIDADRLDSCKAYVESRGWGEPAPFSPLVRASLVGHALYVGGSGAFVRLRESEGTASQRLESMSGMAIEELVASWQKDLLNSGGSPTSLNLPLALSGFFWIFGFAGMALRSSRWK